MLQKLRTRKSVGKQPRKPDKAMETAAEIVTDAASMLQKLRTG
jgi:hypothetical protein